MQPTDRELEWAESELVPNSFSDDLTGLANRPLFLDRLANSLARGGRGSLPSVVMFLDLDRFKWVNDSLGHEVGDQLLVEVARRITDAARPGDTDARLGGEVDVLRCVGPADESQGWAQDERLQQAVSAPFELAGRRLHVTMSIGLALASPDDVVNAEDILRDADLAMYMAKELGRDRIEIFDEPMRRSATARLESESALRRAIEHREFVVYYQPIMNIATSSVIGVEALVRWIRADGAVVTPDEFIPLAEDSGLIGAIGAQVLADACSQVASWNTRRGDRRPLRLSVNLSTRQLAGSELPGLVSETLTSSGLDPSLLSLEITESTLMEGETARAAVDELKALGVTLVIDDFGTGYSSLLYLRRLPVEVLKIDKSFVAGVGENAEDTAIVTGVIRLAQALGLRTVAEGVETVAQLERLAMLECEFGQGYYWSRPLPATSFEAWLGDFDATSRRETLAGVVTIDERAR
jgi:diguanylate cyclase (GGDEF)-like protein